MLNRIIIKPWIKKFKAFLLCWCLSFAVIHAQNSLTKTIAADSVNSIEINGNQIFNISVTTTKNNKILVSSTLDGEYQNKYQIALKQEGTQLFLALNYVSFEDIPDDKRNAHKVIAATLKIEIPEDLMLNIKSDVGSVNVTGQFESIFIELLQGYCNVVGKASSATINTIDGNIKVATNNAVINANSKHGNSKADLLKPSENVWHLYSINGDITVVKQE